jgi:peptidoglycan/xylan/chitin deacetylase (PgdA/CDA1 family)
MNPLRRALRSAVHTIDRVVATGALRCGRERPALIGLAFHGVYEDEREATSGMVAPFQPLTIAELRRIVDHFRTHGYRFVTPGEVAAGLDPGGLYVWLTFDDGYANSLRALQVLREFAAPATFFVSTNHVLEGRPFWWDVLYRHRRRRGVTAEAISRELLSRQQCGVRELETFLGSECGADARRPAGDTDRPLTADELRRLAGEPLATIGNHTADHAALPALSDDEVRAQIRTCQAALAEITGSSAEAIAYPYGLYDARVMRLARAEGLEVGAVVIPRKNSIPLGADGAMAVRRYLLRTGAQALDDECRACRSDLQVVSGLRRLRRRNPSESARSPR